MPSEIESMRQIPIQKRVKFFGKAEENVLITDGTTTWEPTIELPWNVIPSSGFFDSRSYVHDGGF